MKYLRCAGVGVGLLMACLCSWPQIASGSLDIPWNEGAKDCKASTQAPIEAHAYNPQTIILRENLCATFEAPFMYVLLGSTKALLIDTGYVADPNQMPLAKTVMHLLPEDGAGKHVLIAASFVAGTMLIVLVLMVFRWRRRRA